VHQYWRSSSTAGSLPACTKALGGRFEHALSRHVTEVPPNNFALRCSDGRGGIGAVLFANTELPTTRLHGSVQKPASHRLAALLNGQLVVIDGHCRLEAYRKSAGVSDHAVPVSHFEGPCETPRERAALFAAALCHSVGANSKDKLPMRKSDKYEAAWKLVCFNEDRRCYSTREVEKATGVSKSTVQNMTRTLKDHPVGTSKAGMLRSRSWADWKAFNQGKRDINTKWRDALKEKWRKRLHTAFGKKPVQVPDVMAEAIDELWPRVGEHWREQGRTEVMEEYELEEEYKREMREESSE
jgi:hypothetical protein